MLTFCVTYIFKLQLSTLNASKEVSVNFSVQNIPKYYSTYIYFPRSALATMNKSLLGVSIILLYYTIIVIKIQSEGI